jgi:cytochrome c-type biogenesis protein CcmF
MSSSPDTKHYLLNDLYTHITAIPSEGFAMQGEAGHDEGNDDKNYDEPVAHEVAIGDTIHYRDGFMLVKSLNKQATVQNIPLTANDVAIGANIEVHSHDGKIYNAEPVFMIRGGNVFDFARKVEDAGLKLRFSRINPDNKKVEITVYQQPQNKRPWIVMRAISFPYINFFWSGTIIMVIGFLLSIQRRNKELKTV